MRAGIPLAVALGLSACVHDDESAPNPPDVRAVVEAYERPTAPLTQDNAPEVIEALQRTLDDLRTALEVIDALEGIVASLDASTDAATDGLSVRRQALSADFDGWARVEYVCPGLAPSVVDRRLGTIEMFALVAEGGLKQPVWGNARGCALPDSGGAVLNLDGEFFYEVAAGVISFTGSLAKAGEAAAPFGIELQTLDGGALRHRVVLPEGHLILGWEGQASPDAISVHDANGQWSCGVSVGASITGRCSGPGGEVSF